MGIISEIAFEILDGAQHLQKKKKNPQNSVAAVRFGEVLLVFLMFLLRAPLLLLLAVLQVCSIPIAECFTYIPGISFGVSKR